MLRRGPALAAAPATVLLAASACLASWAYVAGLAPLPRDQVSTREPRFDSQLSKALDAEARTSTTGAYWQLPDGSTTAADDQQRGTRR